MSQYPYSQKIKILSFVCIILVLYIHSGFHDYPNEIHGMAFNFKLQNFISGMFGRCAVPLFYAISGFLFFIGLNDGNRVDYTKLLLKIKKRVKTLLVPYLIACLFPAVFSLGLEFIPGVGRFVNGGNFSDNFDRSVSDFICFIYLDSGSGTPYAFHLWFLRDLIFIVVLSPILLYAVSKVGKYFFCGILFVMNYFSIPILPIYGMFWFVFGLCFLDKMSNIKSIYVPIVFLVFCIFEMLYPSACWGYAKIPIIVIGIVSIWILYDMVCPDGFDIKRHYLLLTACGYTFFIYLFHEPTLNIVRTLLVIPFHNSGFGFAFSYLVSPWIFAIIWIMVGMFFKKVTPNLYNVCVGGR